MKGSAMSKRQATHESHRYFCVVNIAKDCDTYVDSKRADILNQSNRLLTCLKCGDAIAKGKKHIVQIPYSKGAYQYIHNPQDLFFTNPKRTT